MFKECLYISTLSNYCNVQDLYQLTISVVCSFIKLLIYMNKIGRLRVG